MTKSTITRERLQELAEGQSGFNLRTVTHEESQELAHIALATLASEPVAEVYQPQNAGICAPLGPSIRMLCPLEPGEKLYRHAQQPVVPDESYQQLSELYHAQEKRLFKIAQRIKGPAFDKYSHSPSQAIDVLEVAIFGDDESCRAAILQTAPAHPFLDKGHKWSYGLIHPENCQCVECRSAMLNGGKS